VKISEARKHAYKLMNFPDGYDGDVYMPSTLSPNADSRHDKEFLIRLGEMMFHVLNRRKSK